MSGSSFSLTPNLGLFKPTLFNDPSWGQHWNTNADRIDAAWGGASSGGPFLPLTGGTMSGPLNYTATGGTTMRSAQDRAADRINVLDFGAKGDGTTDDYAAICAARDSKPSGSSVNLWFPGNHDYHMNAAVQPNGRTLFFFVDPTSKLSGVSGGVFAPYFYPVAAGASDGQARWETYTGPPRWGGYQAVGQAFDIINDGSVPTGGYGVRTSYVSHAAGTLNKFDLLRGDLMAVATPAVTPGSFWVAHWTVMATPLDTSNGWGSYCHEVNPINRADDTGWSNYRSALPRFTGGVQVSPEAVDFFGAGTGRNITFAFVVTRSASVNTLGFNAQSYNGLLIEPNSIAPGGRGVYVGGYTAAPNVPATAPTAAVQVDMNWQYGIDLRGGTFSAQAIASPGFSVAQNGDVSACGGATTLHATGGIATTGRVAVGDGGATFNSGPGAPAGIQPTGSLFARTDGLGGARLYVSNGAGVWNPVAGV